jgi:hypothetical protein
MISFIQTRRVAIGQVVEKIPLGVDGSAESAHPGTEVIPDDRAAGGFHSAIEIRQVAHPAAENDGVCYSVVACGHGIQIGQQIGELRQIRLTVHHHAGL